MVAIFFVAAFIINAEAPLRRPTKAERYEAVISYVAAGLDVVASKLLPDGSTMDDVENYYAATILQAMRDSTEVRTRKSPTIAAYLRDGMDKVMRRAYPGENPILIKALRYVGNDENGDLLELEQHVAQLFNISHGAPRLDAYRAEAYKRHDNLKRFCIWFSRRWEDACKNRWNA
ncbi:hypothetical protein AAVH_06390 [Aphelenchoides avenae]|nr:hypothetical protein AAVH_06390 [Aphelenchus avenae]